MSAIDAAIIKKLVDHIGGGAGDEQTDPIPDVLTPLYSPDEETEKWIFNDYGYFVITDDSIPEILPAVGDILKIRRNDGSFIIMECTDVAADSPSAGVYSLTFKYGTVNIFAFAENNTIKFMINGGELRKCELPDNISTGFLHSSISSETAPGSLTCIVQEIIDKLNSMK